MVFDGSGPLVKRCDGFDGSLWSNSSHNLHSSEEVLVLNLVLKKILKVAEEVAQLAQTRFITKNLFNSH